MKLVSLYPIRFALVAAASAVIFVSCQKNTDEDVNAPAASDPELAAEMMEADASYNEVQDIALTAADEEGIESAGRGNDVRLNLFLQLRLRIGNNASITVSPNDNTYPKTVTIDFGNGAMGADLRSRKGKIILHLTGPIREAGSVLTITLENYKVGPLQISGTKVITNLSANGEIRFSVEVDGGQVRFPNGRGYVYETSKYITQVAGAATQQLSDDIYEIEGEVHTTFSNGRTVTLTTIDNLVKKANCAWVSDGSLDIEVNGVDFSLDYRYPANGGCDNKALLQWNNNTEQKIVILP